MKKTNLFVQFVAGQMQDAGIISYKSMFGGYTFYCDGKIVALVCDDVLFVKTTTIGRKFIRTVKEASSYPGAKPCFAMHEQIDDKEWMSELIRVTAAALPLPKLQTAKKRVHKEITKQ
jgi:TfoX/Sxy family transcriptional regulator of competence genes